MDDFGMASSSAVSSRNTCSQERLPSTMDLEVEEPKLEDPEQETYDDSHVQRVTDSSNLETDSPLQSVTDSSNLESESRQNHIGLGMYQKKEKSKRRELSLKDKIKLITASEGKSHRQLANLFGIGKTQVGTVLRRKFEIIAAYKLNNESTLRKRTRCRCDEDIDGTVWQWYQAARADNQCVSGPRIQEKCREIAQKLGKVDFKASNGWLDSFKSRHNIYFGTSPKEPVDSAKLWSTIFPELSTDYEPKDIYVMQETKLYYHLFPDRLATAQITDDATTDEELKEHVTVALCVNRCGEFETPLVIGLCEKPPCFRNISMEKVPVMWRYNRKNALMNSDLFRDWLEEFNGRMRAQRRDVIVIVDESPAHPKNFPYLTNIKLLHLPKDAAAKMNPMNLGIICAMKVNYRKRFLESVMVKVHEGSTSQNATNSITLMDVCHWISSSTYDVKRATAHRSFLQAHLSMTPIKRKSDDNSQDVQSLTSLLSSAKDWMTLHDPITDPYEYASIDSNAKTRDESPHSHSDYVNGLLLACQHEPESVDPKGEPQQTEATNDGPAIQTIGEALECTTKLRNFCLEQNLSDVWSLLTCAQEELQTHIIKTMLHTNP